MDDKGLILNEVRYAERLCERSARFYRRLQSGSSILLAVGGTAALAAISDRVPSWISLAGAAVAAVLGAYLLESRPGDKAALQTVEAKRYAKLRTAMLAMDVEQARAALAGARESDIEEVELLRDVAYNDVMTEAGWGEPQLTKLRPLQRLVAALA